MVFRSSGHILSSSITFPRCCTFTDLRKVRDTLFLKKKTKKDQKKTLRNIHNISVKRFENQLCDINVLASCLRGRDLQQ